MIWRKRGERDKHQRIACDRRARQRERHTAGLERQRRHRRDVAERVAPAQRATRRQRVRQRYGAKNVISSRSEPGLRTDKSLALNDAILTLRGRTAWAHNFDIDRSIAATFQSLPGASFVVNGAAQAREAELVTGSAEMKWANGFALAATFEGEFSNTTTTCGISARVERGLVSA